MDIVADESVDYGIVLELRNQELEVYSILEMTHPSELTRCWR